MIKKSINLDREASFLLLIFLLALVLRLLFNIFIVGLDTPPINDATQYDAIGYNLSKGNGFMLDEPMPGISSKTTSYRAPLLPFLLAGIYVIFGHSYPAAKIMLSILGAFTCIVIYFIGKHTFDRKVGFLSALISCIYPFFIYYTGYLLSETPFVMLVCMFTLSLIIANEKGTYRYFIMAGILLGFACLCRPTMLIIPPFILLWLVIISRNGILDSLKRFVVIILIMISTIAPWTIRNYKIHHHFVPVTTIALGSSLWQGNNPLATGKVNYGYVTSRHEFGTFESEVDDGRFYQNLAISYMKDHPKRIFKLAGRKFVEFWKVTSPNVLFRQNLISIFSYGIILFLFCIGVFLSIKQWQKPILLILMIIYYTLIHMIFPVTVRYRLPIEPFLIVFAAYGFLQSINFFNEKTFNPKKAK